jgi:hypothetical protein
MFNTNHHDLATAAGAVEEKKMNTASARRRCEGLALLQGVTIQRDACGSVYTLTVDAPFGSTYVDAHCIVQTGRYANWRKAEPILYAGLLETLKQGLIKCDDAECDVCVEDS